MNRVVSWLQHHENRMFFWMNHKINHSILDKFFYYITHLGGATFTLSFTLLTAWFAPNPWNMAGAEGFIALVISHIPVALLKRKYPRLRPYLVLPKTNIYKNPLTDHSFPSGHTTAIFSVLIPFVLLSPWLGIILIPLAVMVGLSRIYLGLHYPSDCLAGCTVGSVTALITVMLFN